MAAARNFDAMTEAELEAHLQALSARRLEVLAEIKAEALAATRALDRKLAQRRAQEALRRIGLGHVRVVPDGIPSTAVVGGE